MGLLPNDLVEEILCRVPATSLRRLSSTCKRWNHLFKYDCRFQRKHSEKAPKQFLPLMLNNDCMLRSVSINFGEIPSFQVSGKLRKLVDPRSPSYQFRINKVSHCDGLLLCTTHNVSTIVVLNPCTGETKWIDIRHFSGGCRKFVLGYSQDNRSCNKSYKIMGRSYTTGEVSAIFDLNSDSWRIVGDVTQGPYMAYIYNRVSLKGNTYWLATVDTEEHRTISILKFDFTTEKSKSLPLPYQDSSYQIASLSDVREERLSVLLQRRSSSETEIWPNSSEIEIWVTNKIDENQEVSWNKVLAFSLSPDIPVSARGGFLLEGKKVIMGCDLLVKNNDRDGYKDTICIVTEDNKVTKIDFRKTTQIFSYVPSLVRIHPTRGKRSLPH